MGAHGKIKDDYADFEKFSLELKRTKQAFKVKKIDEMFGDLFSCPDEYSLAHCVAEDLSMGKGIAKTFKSQFKEVEQLKGQTQKAGGLAVLKIGERRFIYYLVTKKTSSAKPTYPSMYKSLIALRKHIIENEVSTLAMPRIGCGLDRLEWAIVSNMLEYIFMVVPIKINVYVNREFDNKKSSKMDAEDNIEEKNDKKPKKKQTKKGRSMK